MEHDDQNITAVDSQFLDLCGITASTKLRSRIWHYAHDPERFASVTSRMQDYATAFTPAGDVRALAARARVHAILIMSLALAKRKRLHSAAGGAGGVVPQQQQQQRRDVGNGWRRFSGDMGRSFHYRGSPYPHAISGTR